ncbi:MAG: type II toxin-antitoxin system VapC family toxin [Verrucomicrobia bacterium]|nr:type II toxin-antitoxin system VapC family toxin [Verrucomicrobiota bacterium]
MIYFDTSYIIKCYLNEAGSAPVRRLAESSEGMGCSLHGRVEFWTAVKRNVRERLITAEQAAATFRLFQEDESNGVWHWFPVETNSVHLACEKIAAASDMVFLRAADALHLASALTQRFQEIYTHDRHMLAAAAAFGLQARDIIAEG